jgi:hypothetical protein
MFTDTGSTLLRLQEKMSTAKTRRHEKKQKVIRLCDARNDTTVYFHFRYEMTPIPEKGSRPTSSTQAADGFAVSMKIQPRIEPPRSNY